MTHKDLKDRSERSQTKMAALGRDNERLDPSVLTVLASFWREFLNAAAKLSSLNHNKDIDDVYKPNSERSQRTTTRLIFPYFDL